MAYASLLTLAQTLDEILQTNDTSPVLKSLQENVGSLLSSLETPSCVNNELIVRLEERIRDITYEAEDIIESHISNTTSDEDGAALQKVEEELDSISHEVLKIKASIKKNDTANRNPSLDGSSKPVSDHKSSMVGFDDYVKKIKDWLTMPRTQLDIISIVGMGGSGKTTLARNIYDELRKANHFDICSWITVSQEYRLADMLTGLLSSTKNTSQDSHQADVAKLSDQLYKSLQAKKYLIVMDDLWDIKAWDAVRRLFPDNGKGSRIILTTRELPVAKQAASNHIQELEGLDPNQSWNLLHQEVFGKERCPLKFEKIGKKIAEGCKGLPLSLVVVGGLLSKADRTLEYWNYVAENVYSEASKDSNIQLSKILSLSYNQLPYHLRACFLYMGVLPEDYEIRRSKLTKLWVANGFIKPKESQRIEELAEKCLHDLTDRNLIMVNQRSNSGHIKSCSIHDSMRELCLMKAKEEKFLLVLKNFDHFRKVADNPRHLCFRADFKNQPTTTTRLSLTNDLPFRSIIFFGHDSSYRGPSDFIESSRLLRVLDALTIRFDGFPDEIVEVMNLRYLALTYWLKNRIPASISKLSYLETLIVNPGKFKEVFNTAFLPSEIWKMQRLRHIIFFRTFIPYPSDELLCENFVAFENLQTLGNVVNFRWTEEVLKMMPNIKKLVITYEHDGRTKWSTYCFDKFDILDQLEILKCFFFPNSYLKHQEPLPLNFAFPQSLKRLTLSGCRLSWEDMTIVGSLPCLEVLKLKDHAFEGPEWTTNDDEFDELKFLLIEESDLKHWITDFSHFQSLQRLTLKYCYDLKEVPYEFGDVVTLQEIELIECSSSAVASAKAIVEKQKSSENYEFQVVVKDENTYV